VAVLLPAAARAGTVRAVSVSAASIPTGQSVSVTVSGSNPCGAANVNWGDGNAITYAITGLPSTHSHSYSQAGTYSIVARGMGNCDGEATTSVRVTAPAPPPAAPPPAAAPPSGPVITNVSFTPSPAVARKGLTIDIEGKGACAFVVEYGDGNKQTFQRTLPARVTHTYGAPGEYRVIVGPTAPCSGKFTQTLRVQPQGGASIDGLQISPSQPRVRDSVAIKVLGTGVCAYRIDFGDGNSEDRNHALPDTVPHVYSAADSYTISVEASAGCSGGTRRSLTVTPPRI
jgi:hypothetical protein